MPHCELQIFFYVVASPSLRLFAVLNGSFGATVYAPEALKTLLSPGRRGVHQFNCTGGTGTLAKSAPRATFVRVERLGASCKLVECGIDKICLKRL